MITYNVANKFFAKKAEAESYRKSESLPSAALNKIAIAHRDELTDFLNALCGPPITMSGEQEQTPQPQAMIHTPDCVPLFLKKAWEKREDQN